MMRDRTLPEGFWNYTDDTVMAMGIARILTEHGEIDRDALAKRFADDFSVEPLMRGYGGMAIRILTQIGMGIPWREASSAAFEGMGSFGNGGAMRAAPVGAYFWDDSEKIVEQARASAEVTHFHPEGQAGAIASAAAAGIACRMKADGASAEPGEFLQLVAHLTPAGETREGIERAVSLPANTEIEFVVETLGNGSQVSAQDTVPFALWCAAHNLSDYCSALWRTVSGGGDMDTTCAIVGGIAALACGKEGIPQDWLERREALKWNYPQ